MSRFSKIHSRFGPVSGRRPQQSPSTTSRVSAARRRRPKSRPGTSTCAPTSRACPRDRVRSIAARNCSRKSARPATAPSASRTKCSRRWSAAPPRTTCKTGRVKGLSSGELPQRTTFTKVATISTVFDYIQRAMPWTAPKSLKPDEVYAILAYMLNLSEMVPADFVLSDKNIADVQKMLPNRNGMTTDHGMWPGASAAKGGMGNGGKPDTKNTACMKNCKTRSPDRLDPAGLCAHGARRAGRPEPLASVRCAAPGRRRRRGRAGYGGSQSRPGTGEQKRLHGLSWRQ